MPPLRRRLKEIEAQLRQAGIPHADQEAARLLRAFSSMTPLDWTDPAHPGLSPEQEARLQVALVRRCQREPLAYILGSVPFMGLELEIDERTLIPRPETELLVEHVIQDLKARQVARPQILDLCTGSGCIALSLADRLPQAHVAASDLSPEALDLSRKNGQRLGLEVEWRCGDLLAPWQGRSFDLLVCNPPYIARKEWEGRLDPEVQREPALALYGGEDGLLFYRRLAAELPAVLAQKAMIWLEIGFDQGNQVKEIFASLGRGKVWSDWSGQDRFFQLEVGSTSEL
ncbi:MAG: peptide chain release factor N(5)-glutamine methyltransferase [Chlamydiia bacterium]